MKTYEFGNADSDIVLIQPVDDHDLEGIENEFATIINSCDMNVRLIAVRIDDWNKDLSPWEAPAASPSMWFPGFSEYMKKNEIKIDTVYFSLGDREEKARNPVMATVGDRIREAHALLKERGVNCILEWNEGNHFRDADLRTAKAFAWALHNKACGGCKEKKERTISES